MRLSKTLNSNRFVQPLRIVHVLNNLYLAGMEYGVIKLVNQLDPNRFAPAICCLKKTTDGAQCLLQERIPLIELTADASQDLKIVLKLAALLRNRQVNVVHSHNWNTFFYTVVAAKIAGTGVAIHGEHGRDEVQTPLRRIYFERLLARWVDRLVTVSSDLAEELIKRWKIKPEKVLSVPNGVDLEVFGRDYSLNALRQELGLSPEDRIAINVGGLRKIKDHHAMLRVFARTYKKVPNARLLIVGRGIPGAQAELHDLADKLGIVKAVRFTGLRLDIPQLLALSNVYINSSRFEGLSNTILEAMASRKPVVATAVGGNPELVKDGVNGFLIPLDDEELFAERLAQILTDSAFAQRMGVAGRQRVERHYSMSGMVQKYSDLYEESYARHHSERVASSRQLIKKCTSFAIRRSGIAHLRETAQPSQLTILTYHRVLPLHQALQYPFQAMVTPRDLFEAEIAYIAKHKAIVGLSEAADLMRGRRLPKRAVAVTFDDGYRDNFEHALPILKKYKVPATFFLVTGVLDGKVHLWWEDVAIWVQELAAQRPVRLDERYSFPSLIIDALSKVNNGSKPEEVAEELVRNLNQFPWEERATLLEKLFKASGSVRRAPRNLMLGWNEASEMSQAGMDIGSHSESHVVLDGIAEEAARQEIGLSVQRLHEQLRRPVKTFAFPQGRYNETVKRIASEYGIVAAVTTEFGVNDQECDLLQLRRMDAGYLHLKNSFDPNVFEAELQGWFKSFHLS